ncbi:hypothetical protein LK994_06625 [Ferruginibacter lapsinanis]|uniref:hypothetical protein n=1 Tax=Ferruginibacter lapsinanis TaxID=563172 RepID=UPI001E329DC3|nr:hypothetical protein [Ferruginibacter lapsinanis]UEG51147.1 hypothetical protein LK994_06625 [Ferruginibacter lapsinanis]
MKKSSQNCLQYAIWIDQKKAIIACMNKEGQITTESLNSSLESHVRFAGETSNKNRLFAGALNQEKHIQNRQHEKQKAFVKEVASHLSKVQMIMIMGPAEVKYELHRELEKRKALSAATMIVKSADKMPLHEIKAVLKDRAYA